jgi:type IV pilus assembly protein PilZ
MVGLGLISRFQGVAARDRWVMCTSRRSLCATLCNPTRARRATIELVSSPASPAQPIELRIQYKRQNSFFADYAKNIHRGYTFIATDHLLDVGTGFLFRLDVPGLTDGLVLRGTVQWVVTPAQRRNGAGMGIRFVFDSEHERAGVEAVVETLMVAALGRDIFERLVRRPSNAPSGTFALAP